TVWNGAIRLWDVESGREIDQRPGHVAGVTKVIFSNTGNQLISGGEDHTVRMWDIASGKQIVCLHGHHGDIHSLALDRATILSGSANEFVRWRPVFVNYRKEAMEGHWQSRF